MWEEENNPENSKKIRTRYYDKVLPFYNFQGESLTLQAKRAKISCKLFINPQSKAKILIVNGYNESYLKYAEVIYDLYHKGYSVYAYDHRGQGFSQKFPNQKNRGFLESFDDLIDDLQLFFNFVEKHDKKTKIFMIGHSMGGAVTALTVCQNRINPNRIVLSAPMFGIVLTPFPILEYPIYLISKILSKIGFSHTYAFGQRDCFPLKSFEQNQVTHSLARYEIWQTHIRETPQVQLGGPTFQWVRESVRASRMARIYSSEMKMQQGASERRVYKRKAHTQATSNDAASSFPMSISGKENKIPILLIQAEKDTVVRNDTQDIFLKNCLHSQKKIIHGAKHEILMEVDRLREQTFQYMEDFFTIRT